MRDCCLFQWRAEKDMRDCCFICSLPSYDFEHHGNGFYEHYKLEHNMWSYIYYLIYLTHTNANDYTALDDYVNQLVRTVTSRRSTTTSTSWYVP